MVRPLARSPSGCGPAQPGRLLEFSAYSLAVASITYAHSSGCTIAITRSPAFRASTQTSQSGRLFPSENSHDPRFSLPDACSALASECSLWIDRAFRHAHVRHDAEAPLDGRWIGNGQADPELRHGRIVLKQLPLLGTKPPFLVRLVFHFRLDVHHGRVHSPVAGEQRGLKARLVAISIADCLNGLEFEERPVCARGRRQDRRAARRTRRGQRSRP